MNPLTIAAALFFGSLILWQSPPVAIAAALPRGMFIGAGICLFILMFWRVSGRG